jgi:hypothetical protein
LEDFKTQMIDNFKEEERNAEALQEARADYREVMFKTALKETELKPNNEHDKCARCGEGEGEVPIADDKSTYWICEYCDSELFDNSLESKGLKPRLKKEIDTQNSPAVRSLESAGITAVKSIVR